MDYSMAVRRAIDYIEEHIRDEELTAQSICACAGYSVFHFGRVFNICRGMPLMDYVRARRLSLARADMEHGRSVTDAALDYGFDTPGGFARAFRREFGSSPAQHKKDNGDKVEELAMCEVRMENRSAFRVAGYGIETDVTSGYTRDIGAYWDKYDGENLECKMYQKLQPPKHGEVGICVPRGKNGRAEYLLGVIVDNYDKVESDMRTVDVPAAQYAVFTTPPAHNNGDSLAQVARATWRYAFEKWFAASGYEYDQDALDFEFYDERCHCDEGAIAEIWVPVKKIV